MTATAARMKRSEPLRRCSTGLPLVLRLRRLGGARFANSLRREERHDALAAVVLVEMTLSMPAQHALHRLDEEALSVTSGASLYCS